MIRGKLRLYIKLRNQLIQRRKQKRLAKHYRYLIEQITNNYEEGDLGRQKLGSLQLLNKRRIQPNSLRLQPNRQTLSER